MNHQDIRYILKLASQYEKQANIAKKTLEKKAYWQAALLVGPLVGSLVDYLRSSPELLDNLKLMANTLDDYKSSYGFDKYDALLSAYTSDIKKFLSTYKSVKDKEVSPELISDFESLVASGDKISSNTEKVKTAIENMKSIAGKAFDVLKFTGLNLGTRTDSTIIIELADKIASMLFPYLAEVNSKLRMIQQKMSEQPSSEADEEETAPAPTTPTRRPIRTTTVNDSPTSGGGGALESFTPVDL